MFGFTAFCGSDSFFIVIFLVSFVVVPFEYQNENLGSLCALLCCALPGELVLYTLRALAHLLVRRLFLLVIGVL